MKHFSVEIFCDAGSRREIAGKMVILFFGSYLAAC